MNNQKHEVSTTTVESTIGETRVTPNQNQNPHWCTDDIKISIKLKLTNSV